MRDTDPGRSGAAPDDDHLGRLLAEGLGRHAGGPVDEDRLLAGARRGAVRIRRRRTVALRVAVVLALGLPAGATAVQLARPGSDLTTAGSAASAPDQEDSGAAGAEAESVAGSVADPGSGGPPQPMVASSSPGSSSAKDASTLAPAPMPGSASASASRLMTRTPGPQQSSRPERDASGRVVVPDAALLTSRDLPQAVLERTSDRAPAPALTAVDTCGTALAGLPVDAGSRAVVDEQRTGVTASRWLLGSTVQVYPGDGAASHVAAARRLPCAGPVTLLSGDEAVAGHGRPDAQGRVHWYGVVAVGRTLAEVRVVVPAGAALGTGDVARLLRVAADRVTSSGLAASVDADPALG